MERCAMTGAAANCTGRSGEFVPTGCCGGSSYTMQSGSADPYAAFRRANAAERVCCDLSAANSLPLTMGYIPMQEWCNTYDTQTALCRGSLFPELDKPFLGSRGDCYDR